MKTLRPAGLRSKLKTPAVALFLVLLAGGVFLLVQCLSRQPLLHGQPLEYWQTRLELDPANAPNLPDHFADYFQFREAFRTAGSNDVAFLAHAALNRPSLRRKVAARFWTHAAPRLPQTLRKRLNPPSPSRIPPPTSSLALEQLHRLGPDAAEAIPALVKILNGRNGWHRSAAARSLGSIGIADRRVVRALIRAARDKDPVLRRSAVEALGEIGKQTPKVLPALLDMRDEQDPAVAWSLATALWQLEGSLANAVPLVRRAVSASDASFVWSILAALEENRAIEVAPVMVQLLQESPEPRIRSRAAGVLGNFGPAAVEARAALEQALIHDSHLMVRNSAREALTQLAESDRAPEERQFRPASPATFDFE